MVTWVTVAIEDLGAAVFDGAIEGGEQPAIFRDGGGRAEVDQLHVEILVDDHVLILDISVKETPLPMQVVQGANHLCEK